MNDDTKYGKAGLVVKKIWKYIFKGMSLSENIKKIREFRGFEPPAVIQGAGVKKGSYYAWEAGEYDPGQDNLDKLSRFLQVPTDVFYKKDLTEEYLEKNFLSQKHAPMLKSSDSNGKTETSADELIRHLVNGDSEYVLINKELILERYRLYSIEQIQGIKEEAERKHKEALQELEDRKNQIHGLYKIISELTSKLPPGEVPQMQKAQ